MKTVLSVLAAVVALSVATANAEEGNVSRNTLAKMGFSNIKVMSDAQGMKVRGKWAWSFSGSFSASTLPGSLGGTLDARGSGGAVAAGSTSSSSSSATYNQVNYGPFLIPLSGVAISSSATTSGGGFAWGF